MDSQSTIAIVGALVGAFTGILVALLSNWQQSRLEYKKWLRTRDDEQRRWMQAREDEVVKDLRLAIAELTKKLALGAHIMTLLTWKAKYDSTNFTEEDIVNYAKAWEALYVEIVEARILVAALDKEIHTQMESVIAELYRLEARISFEATRFNNAPQETIQALAEYYGEQSQLENDILEKATDCIGLESVREQFALDDTSGSS